MDERRGKPWKGAKVGDAMVGSESRCRVLAVFDVSRERARRKLRELCKDYGLRAVQRSAFEGWASPLRRRELFERGRRLLAEAKEEARWMVVIVQDSDALSVSMIDGVEGAP
jgi:CRISPR-associated endonuclease Cas2